MALKVRGSVVVAVVLCVLVSAVSASPMFGTGGMMKRRFPGSSDMSYRTYREIANTKTQQRRGGATGGATAGGAVTRFGPQASDESWMFDNEVVSPRTGFNGPAVSRFPIQPAGPVRGDSDEQYLRQYPASFSPRDSYAFLSFPYQAPVGVQYRKNRNGRPQVQGYRRPYYY